MLEQIEVAYDPAEQPEAREREFFGGIVAGSIKGERQRRLAVLCFLKRQEGKLPGLKIADLERLTGCTREELSSTLWYLREKEWVKIAESGEYGLSTAGADVLENRLDDREKEICRAWLAPEKTETEQPAIPRAQAEEPKKESEQTVAGPTLVKPDARPSEDPGVGANSVAHEDPPRVELSTEADSIAHHVQPNAEAGAATKRVVLSMGGKGGVGKTSVMTGLAEWFEANQVPATLLDLDTENKACGSLTHFFGGQVPKINIHTPAGLDAFVDHLADDSLAIVADMGAGSGQVTYDWFDKMYPDVAETGVAFTAIGVVTADPASVESILNWSEALQDRVSYVIVENHLTEHTDFTYWRDGAEAQEFRKRFQPAVIRMDYRLADLENAARKLGVTLGRVAGRNVQAAELQKASLVMRAQSYRRRMFAEFDKVKELLRP